MAEDKIQSATTHSLSVDFTIKELEILVRNIPRIVPNVGDEMILSMLYARIKRKYEENS